MATLFTIIIFVVVLSVLVIFHELGHFLTAKKCGIAAPEFGLGLPPRIFGVQIFKKASIPLLGKKKWHFKFVKGNAELDDSGPTVYSLNWLPLGGFVRIKGENGNDRHEKNSFASHPIWQRLIVIAAGVIMNIILACLLLSVCFMVGMPQANDDVSKGGKIVSQNGVQVVQVTANSPAQQANLRAGDRIISANDQSISTETELQKIVNDFTDKELTLKVKRGDADVNVLVKPQYDQELQRGVTGIVIYQTVLARYPFFQAIGMGFKQAILLLIAIVVAFGELFKQLFTGTSNLGAQLAGPIGIANLTGQMAQIGFVYLLQFVAILSVNLAVLNMLPFPGLDGGRIVFLLIEKVRRKPLRQEIENVINNVGMWLLIILILFITAKDVYKFF